MTLPRDYTLAEIDAMRELIRDKVKNFGLVPDHAAAVTEDYLRTYMMAGITLAALRGGVAKEADPFLDDPNYEKIAK